MSVPSSNTWPSVGLVRAPSMASRVDLPEPERPTIDTNSPARSSRLAPRTAACPGPYRLLSDCAERVTSSPFRLDEGVGRHAAHPPRRQERADETEHGGEHQRREHGGLQDSERRPGERDAEQTE